MPLLGLSFFNTLAIFGIINATDSVIQNVTRIVCLCGVFTPTWSLGACIGRSRVVT